MTEARIEGWVRNVSAPTVTRRLPTHSSAIATGVAILASFVLGLSLPSVSTSGSTFWLFALWLALGTTIVWTLAQPAFSLPMAAITVAMLVYVVLPATRDVSSGQAIIAGNDYSHGTFAAVRMSAVAETAILAGALLARALSPAGRFLPMRTKLASARVRRAALVALGAGVVGVLLFSVVGGANLAQFLVFSSPAGYHAFYASATGTKSGYFLAVQLASGLALVMVALHQTSTDPTREGSAGSQRFTWRRSTRWRFTVLVFAASAFLLLGEGVRARFLVPLVAAGLVWFKTTSRRVAPRRLAIGAAVTVLVVGSVVGLARQASGRQQLSLARVVSAPFGSGSDLFTPLAGLAQTIPRQQPYLDGQSYAETLVFPIPRSLWHGKPTGAIDAVTAKFDPTHSGIAFPEFGEMYANFGLLGVVIGSLIVGLVVEGLWLRLARSQSVRESVFIAVLFAVLLQIFTRGAIAPVLVTFGGLILATVLVCRRKSATLDSVGSGEPGRS